jgi:hypothetical protein
MNPREKKLLIALIAVVGLGLVAFGTWNWFVVPLQNYNKTIASMREDNRVRQIDVDLFNRDRRKLMIARLKSLPPIPNEASTEYVNYLFSVLPRAGLSVEEVTPSQNAAEVKPVAPIPGIKKTGHQMMTFQVKARGTMKALSTALNAMQQTPYEHRIKSMNIDRADNLSDEDAKLIINMMIETLLVAKAETRPGVPPGVDMRGALFDCLSTHYNLPTVGLGQMAATMFLNQTKPAETERRYADLSKRNIFVGETVKVVVKAPAIGPTPPTPPTPPPPLFLRYIKLVGTETSKGEAQYLNLYYTKDEQRLSQKANSGYNTFRVGEKDGGYTFFYGKVLKVDSRDVYFQVKDKVFRWHLGDSLEKAYDEGKNYLTLDFLDELDFEPDYIWAKKEIEKEKGQENKGVAGKKGKGFKGKN